VGFLIIFDVRKVAANGYGLAMWRYSVIRQLEPLMIKIVKLKIFSNAELYSSVETEVE